MKEVVLILELNKSIISSVENFIKYLLILPVPLINTVDASKISSNPVFISTFWVYIEASFVGNNLYIAMFYILLLLSDLYVDIDSKYVFVGEYACNTEIDSLSSFVVNGVPLLGSGVAGLVEAL